MAEHLDLLIEIGTEELPPKALSRLSDALASGLEQGLQKAGLPYSKAQHFAAPRRLAVLVTGLAAAQEDRAVERRGPALAAAFDDDGCPTQAAQGFARSCGVEVESLDRLETDKGAWLAFRTVQEGQTTKALIPAILRDALSKLPTPKRMRWGALSDEFVRPVHWLVLLFGDEVIDMELFGVKAGRETRGHRFHHPGTLYLSEPAAYAPLLETEGRVIADFAARREAIRAQVMEAAVAQGGSALISEALLDEVTGLVEWPVAVLGGFEQRFLQLPPEVLISTMQGHQKYFPVTDGDGNLLPYFITVSNLVSNDPVQVRAGNERVIRPRLSDAAFFWDQDRKRPLADRLDTLRTVVYEERLGSLYDKVQRVSRLAEQIAETLGYDASLAHRAAQLSKCDLLTEVVGEFPELQGVMGRYYALHDGENAETARALDEVYMPRFAGDRLPETGAGRALAIAERLDTLVGIFGIGGAPSGDKDPYALRRAALGSLRIIIESDLNLDLADLLVAAYDNYAGKLVDAGLPNAVFDFMMDRLRGYYLEAGIRPDVFDAVLAQRPTQPLDFGARLSAVTEFRKLSEAESLAAANKRIRNILRQAAERKESVARTFDRERLVETTEQKLATALAALSDEVIPLLDQRDYTPALQRLASLKEPVDDFFDKVMVMTDDLPLRANRLALLNSLSELFLRIADLSRLQS